MLTIEEAKFILDQRTDLIQRYPNEARESHVLMYETKKTKKQLGIWLHHPRGKTDGVRIKLEKYSIDYGEIEIIPCVKSDNFTKKPGSRIPNGAGDCVFVTSKQALNNLLEAYNADLPTSIAKKSTEVEAMVSDDTDNSPTESSEAQEDSIFDVNLAARRVRKGQSKFRNRLLGLYDNRCAISGSSVLDVLEAAHIYEHSKSGINHSSNGLLLRADIHILFDEGLIKIHPDTMQIIIDNDLKDSEYWNFNGIALRARTNGGHPEKEYLIKKWFPNTNSFT